MDLSIIIVNWNTRDLLALCLQSLEANPYCGSLDVIVVDNASTDGSGQMVRVQYPNVRLIENRQNLGFAKANNQAIRASTGRCVLLLNSDTEVRPLALKLLVQFMDDHPECGAAGARLLYSDGTPQVSCYRAPSLSRELWRLFHLDAVWPYASYRMVDWDVGRAREVDVVQGACMILRREALDRVGLLDEDYFMYSEEVDLCHRLRTGGWGIWWEPRATVVHHEAQSTRQVAAGMFIRLYQGKVIFFRKHHSRLVARTYKAVLFAAALSRLALSPLAWLERPCRRRQHLALASNYGNLLRALVRL